MVANHIHFSVYRLPIVLISWQCTGACHKHCSISQVCLLHCSIGVQMYVSSNLFKSRAKHLVSAVVGPGPHNPLPAHLRRWHFAQHTCRPAGAERRSRWVRHLGTSFSVVDLYITLRTTHKVDDEGRPNTFFLSACVVWLCKVWPIYCGFVAGDPPRFYSSMLFFRKMLEVGSGWEISRNVIQAYQGTLHFHLII